MSQSDQGLPFLGNSFEVAAQMIRNAHVHRIEAVIAQINSSTVSNVIAAAVGTATGSGGATGTGAATLVSDPPSVFISHSTADQSPVAEPPGIAEFLLKACATSRHREAALGDLNERFASNCTALGRARATRLYWAEALRSLLPLLCRLIGRAMKWATLIIVFKRLFG